MATVKRKADDEMAAAQYHLKMLRSGHIKDVKEQDLVRTNTQASFGLPTAVARPTVGHSAGLSMPGLSAPNGGVVQSGFGSAGGTAPYVGQTSTSDDSTHPKVLSTSYLTGDVSSLVSATAAAEYKKYEQMEGEFLFQQIDVSDRQRPIAVMQVPQAVNAILRADGKRMWRKRQYPNISDVLDAFRPAGVRAFITDSQNSYRSTRIGGHESTNQSVTVHIHGEATTPRHLFESDASGRLGAKLWWGFVWHREPSDGSGEMPLSYWKLVQYAFMDNSEATDDVTLSHGRLGALLFCGTQMDVKDQQHTQKNIPAEVAEREMMTPTQSTTDAIAFISDQSQSHVALGVGYATHLGAGKAWVDKDKAARAIVQRG